MITAAELARIKQDHSCITIASKYVKLRGTGKSRVGPCPVHSQDRQALDSTSFKCSHDKWVCAVCPAGANGGDVIKLVQLVEFGGVSGTFAQAVERLGGRTDAPPPDPVEEAKRAAEAQDKRDREARETNEFRERERKKVFDIWHAAIRPIAGTPVEDYLRLRGIAPPADTKLRYVAALPFWHDAGKRLAPAGDEPRAGEFDKVKIHTGPAMLAPIVDATGTFRGLHTTWFDLAQPKGKALIVDPDTGAPIKKTKKVRGSTRGNAIVLVACEAPRRLFIGEGIETVLSVWHALMQQGRDLADAAFWSSVDLGNLGGKHAGTIRHPTLKTDKGKAQMPPGPDIRPGGPVIAIPDSVEDLVLLADADSDRFTTQCVLARAGQRFAREGRTVRCAWPPAGTDFNDLLRGS